MKKLLVLAVTFVLFSLGASQASANQLKGAVDYMSNARAGSTTHRFSFTTTSTADIQSMKFEFCTQPSGGCTTPTSMTTHPGATVPSKAGLTAAWSNVSTANGIVILTGDAPQNIVQNTAVSITIGNLTNPPVGSCTFGNPVGNTSSGTCYVLVSTYTSTDATGTAVDNTIVSFTVVADVTVTARVDPTFSFVVGSVPASQINNGITTTVASKYDELNFGNLTANVPRYMAHKLNVTTNTQGGYTVDVVVRNQLTGVYTANNIDPFTAPWDTPADWTIPSGSTPNDNTGWFGANTTDTDVGTNWQAASGKFGGISGTASTVMKSASSDNGTGAVYVTYAVEANVFQPADTYSGNINYNALPTY